MTIALGILAHDSIVIAADTQMTSPEYLKTGRGKIAWTQKALLSNQMGAFAITGAGNAAYLGHLQREFTELVNEDINCPPSTDELQQKLTNRIQNFYGNHVIPFSSYGTERPDVWLIMAYRDKDKTALWATEKNVLTEHETYTTAGIGAMYANLLLSRLFLPMWPMSARTAMLLAAYVVFQVKESIPDCGKDTDIVCIQSDGIQSLDRKTIKGMEDRFVSCSQIEAKLLQQVFVGPEVNAATSVLRDVRKLSNEFTKLLDEAT